MPHSSGGGSSGGGFHSGSSSGGRSGPRYSSRPFVGGIPYVYYSSRTNRPRLCYCSSDPRNAKKPGPLMYIILGLFLLLPIGIVLFTGFRNPQKLSTSYDATMKVEDLVDVISEEEEASLESAFGEFYTLTGISPYLITTDNASVQSHYTDLEDYAYHAYLKRFTDESHWLIVYSGDAANPHKNWAFEGMQGNDTDPIINSRYASIFTESLYKNLSSGEQTIASSVKGAFESIMPTIMESGFYVEPVIIVFCSIWFVGVGIAIASTIRTSIRVKEMKEAVVAPTNPVLKKCSHCGAEYYEGTIAQCRLCGKLLNEDPTSADE